MDPHLGPETPPVLPPLLVSGEPADPELFPLVLQLLPLLLRGLHHLTEHHELLLNGLIFLGTKRKFQKLKGNFQSR